ncbi:hypothetical protein HMPREF2719_00315 [Pseudomonas aeruginosa]|nr:hypothetical protein [Pseudomonas aeruginosa]KQJ51918.1 hypothetical protein AN280_27765 [Pseudomonas aeruginosa]OHP42813.1 hypothetical protein HMPREF2719_00315 [Pseudomonas aeruginosa]
MRSRVAKHPECSTDQIGKSTLLTSLTSGLSGIDCKQWSITGKRSIYQGDTIIRKACEDSNFVGNTLHRFLDGVKVIISQQFLAAEPHDVRMNSTALHIRSQFLRSAPCLWKRLHNRY